MKKIMQTTAYLVLFTTLLVGFADLTQAQPAYQINYQGKITNSSGVAVSDGSYDMEFKLYNEGGSTLWTETLTGANQVSVSNGLFSVMLGSTTPLTSVDFNQALYLGVNFNGDGEMTPRKSLGTVPSAFEARQLGGVASSSFLRSDQADSASGLISFTNGLISTASSTITNLTTSIATTTTLVINAESFTDLTGTGLQNSGGVLTLDSTGDWTGTFDGFEGSYYLANSFSTTSADAWEATQTSRDADDLTNNSIQDLSDVAAMTENFGDLLYWNGSSWADIATSSLGLALSDFTGTTDDLTEGTANLFSQWLENGSDIYYTAGNIGIGTSTPERELVINGDVQIVGGLYDNTNSGGTAGQILSSTNGGLQWVATSSLGFLGNVNNSISPNNILSTGQTDEFCLTYESTGNTFEWQTCAGGASNFLSLTDTPGSYTEGTVYFAGSNQVYGDTDFSFASSTNTLTIGGMTLADGLTTHTGASTTTVPNNNPNAWTIATSTTGVPLFRIDTTGAGSVSIGSVGSDVYIGEVGAGANLIFEESSTISGQGTNTITLGESGDIFNVASGVSFGYATATPARDFSINGDLLVTGSLYDSTNSAGTNGYILQTTGAGTQWVATSSLGINGTADDLSDNSLEDLSDVASMTKNFGDLLYWNGSAWADIATSSLAISSTDVTEGTNLFYTDTRARNAISETITGLDYTAGTGVFSLTAGYNIPLTASTTNWNNFYDTPSTRISAGDALSWSTNTLNLDINKATDRTAFEPGDKLVIFEAGVGIRKIDYSDLPGAGGGITSLNGQTESSQSFATSTSGGIDLLVTSTGGVHTFTANPSSGFTIPLTASTTEWDAAYASTTALTDSYLRGLFSNTATGLTYNSTTGQTSLTAGYNIPLTASTTNWNNFYDTPSTRISAGTDLSWAGNTLNFDNSSGYLTTVDISDNTNLSVSATGLALSGDTIVLTAGYNIPLTASTTDWNTAFLWGDHAAAGYLTNITGESLEDLSDVASMSQATGDLLTWNGSAWTNTATSALAIALSDTTGTLTTTRGGTGLTSYATGDLIYASGANTLAARTIGTAGDVLQVVGGVPQWVATSSLGITGGGGSSSFLGLTDTPGSYTEGTVYFAGSNQVYGDTDFSFASSTNTLTIGGMTLADGLTTHTGASTTTVPNNNPNAWTIATSTTGVPLFRVDTTIGGELVEFGAGGDVYIGGVGAGANLIFEESSTISGQGTNTITLGESGDIFNVASGVSFGYATATPARDFSINGDLLVTGSLYDSTNSAGTNGYILQTTGAGTQWVATSSLGINGTADDLSDNSLEDLSDVASMSQATGDLLTWNGSAWTNTATSALAIALSDTTGTLTTTRGGTGLTSYATGDLIYASGANTLAARTIGTAGDVLQVVGGVPQWVATSSLGLAGTLAIGDSITSATQGSILFAGASGVLAQDNANFFWDDSNNRLGIGTSSPNTILHVYGTGGNQATFDSSSAGDVSVNFADAGVNEWSLSYLDSSNSFNITESGVAYSMTFLPGGNVGVGTTTPSSKLSVAGDLFVTGAFRDSTATAGTNGYILQTTGAGTQWVATSSLGLAGTLAIGDSITSATQGSILFAGASGVLAQDNANFFWDDSNNRLGIGTTNPYESIEVIGTIAAGSAGATSGSTILKGRYAGATDDYLNTFGSNSGTGGTVIGFGLEPKNGSTGFVSSADNFSARRAALQLDGDFRVMLGAAQAVTTGSDVTVTERFTVTQAGSVGIGETSPLDMLQIGDLSGPPVFTTDPDRAVTVGDATDGNEVAYQLYNNDGTNNIRSKFYVDDATLWAGIDVAYGTGLSGLSFGIAGDKDLVIDTFGRVGIGTTTPTRNLSIVSATDAFINVRSGTSNSAGILFGDTDSDSPGQIVFDNTDNSMLFFASGERMRILGNGNIGIGTSSPAAKVEINTGGLRESFNSAADELAINSSGSGGITISTPNTNIGGLFFADTDSDKRGFIEYDHNNNDLAFGTDGTENLTILSSGYVGVGITNPSNEFVVKSDNANNDVFEIIASDDLAILQFSEAPDGSGYMDIFDTDGNADVRLTGSGNSWFAAGGLSVGSSTLYGKLSVTEGLLAQDLSNVKTREWVISSGAGVQSYKLGEIRSSSSVDGAISGTVEFAYDYGTTDNSNRLHFDFSQRSGTARGHWWYEHTDVHPDEIYIEVIDVSGGGTDFEVWLTAEDFALTYVDAKIRHGGEWTDSGGITATTKSSGTTLLSTQNDPTSDFYIGDLYAYGNVGIGTTTPTQKLSISGNLRLTGALFDSNNSAGTAGMVLQSTGSGQQWVATSSLGISGGGSMAIGGSITSATQGSILFAGASGVLAQDNANFFWDDTNNRLGIGTSTPAALLHVTGASRFQTSGTHMTFAETGGAQFGFISGDDTNGFIINAGGTADTLRLQTNGIERATLDNTGFGIGDPTPTSKLDVQGNARIGSGFNNIAAPTNGLIVEGDVGIGTTSPSTKLHVHSTGDEVARFTATGNPYISLYRNNTRAGYMYIDSNNDLQIYNDISDGSIVLDGATSNVGIGTTAPTGAKLHVVSDYTNGHYLAQFASTGSLINNDTNNVLINTFQPGLIFQDDSTSAHDFRWGLETNSLRLSVDTDNDGVYTSGDFDDLTALTINSSGDLDISGQTTFGDAGYDVVLRAWSASDTDIDSLIPGSTFGQIMEASANAHLVVGLRDNDTADSFAIISGGGNWNASSTYDTAVFIAQADGNVCMGLTTCSNDFHISRTGDTNFVIEADSDNTNEADNPLLTLRQDGNLVNGLFGVNGTAGTLYTDALVNAVFIEAKDSGSNALQFVTGDTTIGGTGGTARMTILNNGNVGIGDTSPAALLTVGSGDLFQVNSSGQISAYGDGIEMLKVGRLASQHLVSWGSASGNFFESYSATSNAKGLFINSTTDAADSALSAGSNSINLQIRGSTALIIDNSSNVGIGVTTPSNILSVNGNASIVNGSLGFNRNPNDGTVPSGGNGSNSRFQLTTNGTYFAMESYNTSGTGTGGMYIVGSSGDAGIGVTDPDRKLEVFETVAASQFKISYNASVYTQFQVDSAGDLIIDATGNDVRLNGESFYVCDGAACASSTGVSSGGSITAERAITAEQFTETAGTGKTINWDQGNQQYISLTSNTTITAWSNNTNGQTLRLVVCQDGTGGRTFTISASVKWAGNITPTQTSTANKCDVYSFIQTTAGTLGAFNQDF